MKSNIKCPNCKENYIIKKVRPNEGRNLDYEYLAIHDNKTCPFGLESYQNSEKECLDSAKEYISRNFNKG